MRYAVSPAVDEVYGIIAALFEADDEPWRAMAIAAGLIELGEARSWASVWWAYGVAHHDLSDSGYAASLRLLKDVDHPDEARAAALMLIAEIESTQAIQRQEEPSAVRQVDLLERAVALAPRWPNIRVRLARAYRAAGRVVEARQQAQSTLELLKQAPDSTDPFDSAFTGNRFYRPYIMGELRDFGVKAEGSL